MNKILTIIIPTYNMEKYLRRCLDSLIIDEEGMKQLEVLVINDGSKDTSSQIAHEYQDKYPDTYRVIDKENGNYGSCINRGLKEATGKYVKVLDADDWFDTKNLNLYVDTLREVDADLVVTNCVIVNEKGERTGCFDSKEFENNKEYSFSEIAYRRYFPQMHCVTYRLEMLKGMKYVQTEGISYTDQEWVTKPFASIVRIYYVDIYLYFYLVGRDGQTVSKTITNKSFDHHRRVALSLLDFAESYKGDEEHKNYLLSKAFDYTKILYRAHILELSFNDKDFRTFDDFLKANHFSFYNWTSHNISNMYIPLWRYDKLGIIKIILSLFN